MYTCEHGQGAIRPYLYVNRGVTEKMNNERRITAGLMLAVLFTLSGCAAYSGRDSAAGTPAPAPVTTPSAEHAPAVTESGEETDDIVTNEEEPDMVKDGKAPDTAALLYQGHGSLRITTAEGKVIYVDPYAGEGYDLPADLILVTHQHSDHNQLKLIRSKNPGCEIITEKEALKDRQHQSFDLGYAVVEAVEAANKNHKPAQCVGYIITLNGGIRIYISGDTSKTAQMESFADRMLDYAFLCADGRYNMDIAEASECAAIIGARHSIPYHLAPGELFSRELAEQFEAKGRLIVADGEEITLAAGS